ncbi:MAG: alpha/beta fold hydrolase [Beijerinckiaceae bacterium]
MNDIVFIPGLNCTAALFAPQIKALSAHARCHVADHSTYDNLELIAGSILAKAPANFALVGLSMGGYVAFEMIRQQPHRISKVALLDTRATMDSPEAREMREKTIQLASTGQFEKLHGILWQRLVHPDRLTDSVLQEVVVQMMRDTGAERFVKQQTAVMNRIDYAAMLDMVRVPTLVVTGAQDVITPPEMGRELAAGIAGSQYVEIPDCGHLSTLEKPDKVTDILSKFLDL